MRNFMIAAASAAIAVAVPAMAQKDHGDQGHGKSEQANGKAAKLAAKAPVDARKIAEKSQKAVSKQIGKAEKSIRENVDDARQAVQLPNRDRKAKNNRANDRAGNDGSGDIVRQLYRVSDDGRLRSSERGYDSDALIQGCPPGLAKKGNGCLPPGQVRKIERQVSQGAARPAYFDYLGFAPRYRQNDYAYSDGYAYRTNGSDNLITAFLPLVGGALFPGKDWPQQYGADPVPQYYGDYFGGGNQSNYRFADNTLFGVDPQSQAITTIAGLLTGNDFNVGQRMPSGYDVYNVPNAYRDRYADTAQSQYRYSDGYVYQVDPKTKLIQTAIQLLT